MTGVIGRQMRGVLSVMKKHRGLLISAPSSGTGKTTVTLGLLRALRNRGFTVQPFKSGPDYIDPAFHRFAAGRPSFNLDTWAMGSASLRSIEQKALGSDIIVAEGSMGLYDGVLKQGVTGFGSSAETAMFFGWPVILVIDVSGQAQSAAATALAGGAIHTASKPASTAPCTSSANESPTCTQRASAETRFHADDDVDTILLVERSDTVTVRQCRIECSTSIGNEQIHVSVSK